MAVSFDTPVAAIEGIGPATERRLQQAGVHTVYDLLRASPAALHSVVSHVASIDEVRSWRQMATLLEVAAMTPQWAEALVKSGIVSLADLHREDHLKLAARFEAAKDQRTIPDVPSTDQVSLMLKDAALLDFAGAITGTIADPGGAVAGASIAAAGMRAASDARGRFRLCRLMLDRPAVVTITSQTHQTWTQQIVPTPTAFVTVHQVRLVPLAAGETPAPVIASELAGDRLPSMHGQTVTSHEVPAASLSPRDLLAVTFRYAGDRDVKLVSKLIDFRDGEFVVHWARVPIASFSERPEIGDHFVVTGRGLRKVKMSFRKLHEYKRFLRVRKQFAGRPAPRTDREREAALREFNAVLKERRS